MAIISKVSLRTIGMTEDAGSGTRMAKHSLVVAGHRTSVSLEDAFWTALRAIAEARGRSLAALVADIDARRGEANLSSAIRVFVLGVTRDQYRPAAEGSLSGAGG
jgi:predicted DNA-binding ribbon-helix-helix protein